ncbi:MAG: hypothetical protein E7324_09865 [Clostridiales bacterium]|nr:hypothetical protein [Clostridiales bacterium]
MYSRNYNYSVDTYDYIQLSVGLATFLGLVILAFAILTVIGWCKMFKKAGIPWERVFVPFYGNYWQFKIANCQNFYWWTLSLSLLTTVISFIAGFNVTGVVSVLISIASFVLQCIYCYRLSQTFGHGAGYAWGLVLLYPIFIMILGFGTSTYCGTTYSSGTAPKSAQVKLWTCGACGTRNLFSRSACFSCGCEKPSDAPVSAVSPVTGWTCPKCNTVNSSNRFTCENCSEFRPKEPIQ